MVVTRPVLAIALAGILALPFAGCLVFDGLEDPVAHPLEPFTRISGVGMSASGGMTCPPTSSIPDLSACIDAQTRLKQVECDPPQLVFLLVPGDDRDSVAARVAGTWEPTEGPYVRCTYVMEYEATGRSLVPGTTFHLRATLDDVAQSDSCEVPVNGECRLELAIPGAFTFTGPGEEVAIHVSLDADLENVELLLLSFEGSAGFKERLRYRT